MMSGTPPNTHGSFGLGPSSGYVSPSDAAVQRLMGNYRLTPATLYTRLDPSWVAKEFLLYASMKIAETIVKPNGRLIICWPPRHGKSRLATVASPIWTLENFPMKKVILTTYGDSLSTDFGREVRDIFSANTDILSQRLRSDVKSTGWFLTEMGGGMLSTGVGGPIVGKGADVFLIDDYLKTMDEAMSATTRQKIWEWFTGTAYHRLEPGGSMIIIATRWHSDDLIGRILRNFPNRWEVIKFAAEALPGDPLGREVGEPLFPERFSSADLDDRRSVLGKVFYNALYQQEPEDDDSKMTNSEWINVIDRVPLGRRLKLMRIWDFAGRKVKQKRNDPSVGTLVALDEENGDFYILDVFRDWKSPREVEIATEDKAEQDGVDVPIRIEQEPGASGIQLISHYRTNILKDYNVKGVPATTSKLVRAQPLLGAAEKGKVFVLDRSWTQGWLNEFDFFPAENHHDDQLDTAAIGYNELTGVNLQELTFGRGTTSRGRKGNGSVIDPTADAANKALLERIQAERDAEVSARSEDSFANKPQASLTWGRKRVG